MTLRKSNWMAAACMAVLSVATSVYGEDDSSVGIVRISDGRSRTGVQPASFHGHGGYGYGNAGYGGCPYGGCPNPYCQPGAGAYCLPMFRESYCKHSPDYGYSPPAKYPLHRRGVQYTSNFPAHWYGTPGGCYVGAPMVYQPTDTTQLGYSYQHVPFWQPTPGMLPQRPIPAQWHRTAPTVNAATFNDGCSYSLNCRGCGFGFCHGFGHWGCQCPICQMPATGTAPAAQPTPVPADSAEPKPTTSLPPSPRQFENSAESGHIRRAAFE